MEHPDIGATVIDFMASTARFSNVGDEVSTKLLSIFCECDCWL